jgi:hypothetical protein
MFPTTHGPADDDLSGAGYRKLLIIVGLIVLAAIVAMVVIAIRAA